MVSLRAVDCFAGETCRVMHETGVEARLCDLYWQLHEVVFVLQEIRTRYRDELSYQKRKGERVPSIGEMFDEAAKEEGRGT